MDSWSRYTFGQLYCFRSQTCPRTVRNQWKSTKINENQWNPLIIKSLHVINLCIFFRTENFNFLDRANTFIQGINLRNPADQYCLIPSMNSGSPEMSTCRGWEGRVNVTPWLTGVPGGHDPLVFYWKHGDPLVLWTPGLFGRPNQGSTWEMWTPGFLAWRNVPPGLLTPDS